MFLLWVFLVGIPEQRVCLLLESFLFLLFPLVLLEYLEASHEGKQPNSQEEHLELRDVVSLAQLVVTVDPSVTGKSPHSAEKVVEVITTIDLVDNYRKHYCADVDGLSGNESAVHLLMLLFLSLSCKALEHVEILTGTGRGLLEALA
jgi:hypothetical protein